MTLSNWLFYAPTKIVFGPGSVASIADEVKALGASKLLIATDKGVAGAGVLKRVVQPLEAAGLAVTVYDGVEPNPSVTTVEKCYALFVQNGCELAIGLGGGSSMDTAKATCILATNPGPITLYGGANKVPNTPAPSIAIPTTAGTGAEVTQTCVVTDSTRNYKVSVRSTLNVCKTAVLDPLLLTSLPSAVVASTGMDALSHAVESYLSSGSSVLTEALSLEATRVIAKRLRAFVANPSDESAAADMLYASMTAGLAFSNGRLTAVHAIAHALGGHVPRRPRCGLLPYARAGHGVLPPCGGGEARQGSRGHGRGRNRSAKGSGSTKGGGCGREAGQGHRRAHEAHSSGRHRRQDRCPGRRLRLQRYPEHHPPHT